ncbi:OLC1v1015431C2 [Oldenlandia corymbosa var. corymbosa]|nr:OLC1v1015431C2 [Oldenlandia corymbosa var. corymbosa]
MDREQERLEQAMVYVDTCLAVDNIVQIFVDDFKYKLDPNVSHNVSKLDTERLALMNGILKNDDGMDMYNQIRGILREAEEIVNTYVLQAAASKVYNQFTGFVVSPDVVRRYEEVLLKVKKTKEDLLKNGSDKYINTKWEKGKHLGSGSFGSVFEALSDQGFFFAVKEVSFLDQGEKGRKKISLLEKEIALLSRFKHENIVRYLGSQKDEQNLYIFLEHMPKGSLKSIYKDYELQNSQVSTYARQVVQGLKYIHDKGVIHGDIKCDNILVDVYGCAKLADFGLAKFTELNDGNFRTGTPRWMAPEVVKNQGNVLASDIWSLGCTVLEMLTREYPYADVKDCELLFRKIIGGELPGTPENLSSDAKDFIVKCLQYDPNARPDAAKLLEHPFVNKPPSSESRFSGSSSSSAMAHGV